MRVKLATLREGGPDGTLVVVSADGTRCRATPDIATTMQQAIERWDAVEPRLRSVAQALGEADRPVVADDFAAPLPRAWQWLDGSVYPSHGELMDRVLGVTKPPVAWPLMYQGMSDLFYAPTQDVPMADEALGIDFEGEFGIITDTVPMSTRAEGAAGHIKLLVQINDWSLRTLAGPEMKTGFGWIQAKPACSMAPFAITPDELGEGWRDHRPQIRLAVDWNGRRFGDAHGGPMAYGFDQLVAHAARTRRLVAGTVIGSGTVSNPDYRQIGSSCIAERRGIEVVDEGQPRTEFMRFGDRVRMAAHLPDGREPFGAIDQKVVSA